MPPREGLRRVAGRRDRRRHRADVGVEVGTLTRVVAREAACQRRVVVEGCLVLGEHAARVRAVDVLGRAPSLTRSVRKVSAFTPAGEVDLHAAVVVNNRPPKVPQPDLNRDIEVLFFVVMA